MIQEDYVTFEQAKLLKEKGFPQESTNEFRFIKEEDGKLYGYKFDLFGLCDDKVCFPILSLVQKWLREEKKLHIEICFSYEGSYIAFIKQECYQSNMFQGVDTIWHSLKEGIHNSTYEEALSAGINKVLELI